MKVLHATRYNVYMQAGDLVTLRAVKSRKLGTVVSLNYSGEEWNLLYKVSRHEAIESGIQPGHIIVFWSAGEWQGQLKAHNAWDIELVR